jgi:hypothetical protein
VKRSSLRRTTPIRKRRSKPRRGEPTAQEIADLRLLVYGRCGGRCELSLSGCKGGVLPFDGSVFERWHLVHIKARRRFGWDPSNLCGGCYWCHIVQHHGKGMPIPPSV